jgi:pimeloyl-ACP methyl ester carboxylesterase
VVIVTHGWGDARVTMLPRLEPLVSSARRVIIWEMPGHGEAGGVCRLGARELGLLRALIGRVVEEEQGGTALRAVMDVHRVQEDTARRAVPPGIVLYGSSLGAGLSIAAAAGDHVARIAGVIAEAPYRTPIEPAWNLAKALQLPHRVNLPVAMTIMGVLFAGDWRWGRRKPEGVRGFDRAALAASLRVPLLVLHGSEDVICEPASGKAIADAAPLGRFVEIAGGGHNDLWIVPERRDVMMAAVTGFLRELSPAGEARERDPSASSDAGRVPDGIASSSSSPA